MEKHIIDLKKKLIDLRNRSFGFAYSTYEDINFKIWINDFKKIFDDYEFATNDYKKKFDELSSQKPYKRILGTNIIKEEPDKGLFNKLIEEYGKLLNKMIYEIERWGEEYGERFIKIRKKEAVKTKNNNELEEVPNLKAYKILFEFENKFRDFIKNKLKKYYSIENGFIENDWYEKGIPKPILDKIDEKKDDPDSLLYKVEVEYPMEYLNFPDYKRVIETNWENIFCKDLSKRSLLKKIKDNLENLIVPRNKIAHCVILPEDDIKVLENSCTLIKNIISKL